MNSQPERNRLLAALPPQELALLRADCERVRFATGQILLEQDERPQAVYFPSSGAISLVTVMLDGSAVEAGMVGREGATGLGALTNEPVPWRMLVQLPTDALLIDGERFRTHVARSEPLRNVVNRYLSALAAMFAQSAACNRFHSVQQRGARWLLMMHDRAETDEFPLTQEFLAHMVGAHRPTVTLAAQALHDEGLISYRRGRTAIMDREGLEAAACECYGRMRVRYDSIRD
jgi:CRP-like cAMP-binding protein